MSRRCQVASWLFAFLSLLFPSVARAQIAPGPLGDLQMQLALAADHAPGRVGIAVEDLATGYISGINADANLPAASTIKIPVMVEVFKRIAAGDIDFNTVVHLEARDRDWGWGDLADATLESGRTVKQLLWLMISQSDNTATNMLIRVVGRAQINRTMAELGLHSTQLGDDIRSESDTIRYALRTSPADMVRLLDAIARDRLIDAWSSREMLAILTGQAHNGLLPVPLPKEVKIAHKTGSLHDTLNDVGIVYGDEEPYVIAVMTTQLPDLDLGRAFIQKISRITFDELSHFAVWREGEGIPGFDIASPVDSTPVTPATARDAQMDDAAEGQVPDGTAANAEPTATPGY
jgi:beta-lactamase class A